MKKVIAAAITLVMVLGLVGCGGSESSPTTMEDDSGDVPSTVPEPTEISSTPYTMEFGDNKITFDGFFIQEQDGKGMGADDGDFGIDDSLMVRLSFEDAGSNDKAISWFYDSIDIKVMIYLIDEEGEPFYTGASAQSLSGVAKKIETTFYRDALYLEATPQEWGKLDIVYQSLEGMSLLIGFYEYEDDTMGESYTFTKTITKEDMYIFYSDGSEEQAGGTAKGLFDQWVNTMKAARAVQRK